MYSLRRLQFMITPLCNRTPSSQIICPYSMLDKLPEMNVEPIEFEDEPIKQTRSSRAMRSYLRNAKQYRDMIEGEREDYHTGKRHLANMMGCDPENFTQEDVNEAIEYLFPCGLFEKKSRPLMKPPEEVFPPKKEAEFDESGRPYHFLFYTAKPYYFQILHDVVKYMKELNTFEDKVIAGKIKEQPEENPIELSGTQWITKEKLSTLVYTVLREEEYVNFISAVERLMEHPYGYKYNDFIMKFREPISRTTHLLTPSEVQYAEDGRAFVTVENIHKKKTFVNVTMYSPGTGKLTIFGKDLIRSFPLVKDREQILFPLIFSKMLNKVDIDATLISGEGSSAQAVAVRTGIALCLRSFVDGEMVERMRLAGLLLQDPRLKERKKAGQQGARRKFTWKKR